MSVLIGGHEHDGVRRFEINWRSCGEPCSFYSDAVTEEGAWAHFRRNIKTEATPYLKTIGPDEWLSDR